MNKVLLSNKFMGGQVNKLLVDRVNKRQSNMVSRQVNEWTSEQVACIKDKVTDEQSSFK